MSTYVCFQWLGSMQFLGKKQCHIINAYMYVFLFMYAHVCACVHLCVCAHACV